MRITFVLPHASMVGGVRVVAIYAKELARRGHRVTVVSLPPRQRPLRETVRRLLRGEGWPGRQGSHLDGVEVEHRILESHRPVRDADVPDADVVVATWWRTALWVAELSASKGAKVHFVQHYEVWGGTAEEVDAALRLPTRKIVVARWLKELVRGKTGDEGVVLVPNAVDRGQFHAIRRSKQRRPTVGMMYSSAAFKGTDKGLAAVELARQRMGELHLVAFGTERPGGRLALPGDAEFVYRPAQEAMREIYGRCDAWIFASRSEGFGLPILEAMACRTPVVATPAGAAPELLAGGGGVLVGSFDEGAIAEGVVRVCAGGGAVDGGVGCGVCDSVWERLDEVGGSVRSGTSGGRGRVERSQGMTILVPMAMFGWIGVALALFGLLPARRAVIAAYLVGWLFLPVYSYKLAMGIPEYSKIMATSLGVMLGVLAFDAERVMKLQFRWVDWPAAVWCLSPFAASMVNGLGAYDGVSATLRQVVTWGVPYFLGRVYFTDLAAVGDLAVGVFVGGLIYMPLCLWEIRMSPQLHNTVYGFQQHSFAQTLRFGGWRPLVFLQHGLAVSLWMAAATLVGLWLWRSGAVRNLWGVPMGAWVALMGVTTVMCKSAGAVVLLAAGVGVLLACRWMSQGWPALGLALAAVLYMGGRSEGYLPTESLVPPVREMVGKSRADSFHTRLYSEDLLVKKAMERPVLGWGGWGRSRVNAGEGEESVITDGMWVIALGTTGLVGLGALTGMLLLPMGLLVWKWPARLWGHPQLAGVVGLAMVGTLYMLDSLMNAMPNPVFVLGVGAVVTVLSQRPRSGPQAGRLNEGRVRFQRAAGEG